MKNTLIIIVKAKYKGKEYAMGVEMKNKKEAKAIEILCNVLKYQTYATFGVKGYNKKCAFGGKYYGGKNERKKIRKKTKRN